MGRPIVSFPSIADAEDVLIMGIRFNSTAQPTVRQKAFMLTLARSGGYPTIEEAYSALVDRFRRENEADELNHATYKAQLLRADAERGPGDITAYDCKLLLSLFKQHLDRTEKVEYLDVLAEVCEADGLPPPEPPYFPGRPWRWHFPPLKVEGDCDHCRGRHDLPPPWGWGNEADGDPAHIVAVEDGWRCCVDCYRRPSSWRRKVREGRAKAPRLVVIPGGKDAIRFRPKVKPRN